jgi:hypothetical protein
MVETHTSQNPDVLLIGAEELKLFLVGKRRAPDKKKGIFKSISELMWKSDFCATYENLRNVLLGKALFTDKIRRGIHRAIITKYGNGKVAEQLCKQYERIINRSFVINDVPVALEILGQSGLDKIDVELLQKPETAKMAEAFLAVKAELQSNEINVGLLQNPEIAKIVVKLLRNPEIAKMAEAFFAVKAELQSRHVRVTALDVNNPRLRIAISVLSQT